jgi:PBP1b-binding outer membrane lipoprotein LpoB
MIIRRQITIMLLLFSVLLIASCAEKKTPPVQAYTPPVQTSAEKATTSIETVEGDISAMTSRINTTNASLNEVIVSKGKPAAKTAFDTFLKNVSDMDEAAAAFIKDSDQMTARGTDYFREWAKSGDTYTNPQIQQLSEARRSELMNTFSQIAGPSPGVKARVNSYLSQIKQLQTYLSNDLSAAGIDAIIPVAQKAINDGQQIIVDAQPMLSAAEQARAQIGDIGAATGGVSSSGK